MQLPNSVFILSAKRAFIIFVGTVPWLALAFCCPVYRLSTCFKSCTAYVVLSGLQQPTSFSGYGFG